KLSEKGFEPRKCGRANTVHRFGLRLLSDSYPPFSTSSSFSSSIREDRETVRTVREPSDNGVEADDLWASPVPISEQEIADWLATHLASRREFREAAAARYPNDPAGQAR